MGGLGEHMQNCITGRVETHVDREHLQESLRTSSSQSVRSVIGGSPGKEKVRNDLRSKTRTTHHALVPWAKARLARLSRTPL